MDNSRESRYLNDLWDTGRAPWNVWDNLRSGAVTGLAA
jgi:hypothetical protein